ncbi:hypothetical protein DMENIID0001_074530 [Sergentomyia squamirostris]
MCTSNHLGQFYVLPTTVGYVGHDVRFKRNPMFSFGTKHETLKTGDKASMPLGLDSSNVTRFGKQQSPQYSLGMRHGTRHFTHSPGPIYRINDRLTKPNAPMYSLSGRHNQSSTSNSPGPIYSPLASPGKPSSPAFSLGSRNFMQTKDSMPGSNTYGATNLDVCRPRSPQVTMTFRHKELTSTTKTPGPNLYYPKIKSSAKAYSFGMRHHPCSGRIVTPSDDEYI